MICYQLLSFAVKYVFKVSEVLNPHFFFQGAVSGVLLVTPNNIMFDPHRMDPLVQAHGCEEYGIMCPLEEVQSAAICKEITDPKIREAVPE